MNSIRKESTARGITRLCHFTQSRHLPQIIEPPGGLLSTKRLGEMNRPFTPTDTVRRDGHPDHVCCSVQYPNGWYLRKAVGREQLFRDWVVLLLHPSYLWMDGTKFCDTNAATEMGRRIQAGIDAFNSLFADEVRIHGRCSTRDRKPACVPTDDQAEVLIPDQVDRDAIIGLIVSSETQAQRESVRLDLLGLPMPRTLIAPVLYDPKELTRMLRSGRLPDETVYYQGSEDA